MIEPGIRGPNYSSKNDYENTEAPSRIMKTIMSNKIPAALRERPQWVVWRLVTRDGKKTKLPFDPVSGKPASPTDPQTWQAFDDALRACERDGYSGLGFVFSEEDSYCGIDLDHVRDLETGQFEPWARELIKRLDSYTELSPSGTGAHVIVRAKVPGSRRRNDYVEIYDGGRFFCMTGERLKGVPGTVEDRQAILSEIHGEFFGKDESNSPVALASAPVPVALSDNELLEKADSAKNGAHFSALWRGDWQSEGYPSQSEADAALLGMLRFWTGGDKTRSFALFSQSGLNREKWEREDYREHTWEGINAGPVYQTKAEQIFDKLVKLDPVNYDQCRKDEAFELGIRVSTLDQEVAKKRKLAMDAAGIPGELDFSDPEPWPEPISDAERLFDHVSESIARYVVLPRAAADAITLWIVHAHALEGFHITPRLNLSSPEKGCGKTTLLDVIATLLPRPLRTENCTSAVLFRLVDKHCPTLLLDEIDTYLAAHDELRGLLNAGHRKGAKAVRCEGDNNEVRAFNAFAPVVLAGIGSLPGTLHDRSLLIPLLRAKSGEIAHRFDSRNISIETELKTKLKRWSIDHVEELSSSDPVMPESAHNRLADNWRPLFAIAQAVGGSWREKVSRSFEHLNSDAQADEAQGIGTTLLADIKDLFEETGSRKLFSATITERLIEIEGRPWAEYGRAQKPISKNQLARLLGKFKIKSTSLRIGSDTAKGYNLADFSEAFERFLPPSQESLPKRDNVTNPENKGDSDTSETSQISSNPEQSRCETSHEKLVSRFETSHPKPVTFGDSTDLFNFPKEKSTCDVVPVGKSNPAKETTDTQNDVTYV